MASRERVMQLRSELEARLLQISVGATVVIAVLGVLFGLLARSPAILFDGFFSLLDAAITWLTLAVARLVASDGSRRFQYGYWHLESLVILLKASVKLTRRVPTEADVAKWIDQAKKLPRTLQY